jgi:hypothetical protein
VKCFRIATLCTLGVVASHSATAQTLVWQQACAELGSFAGSITGLRDAGRSLDEALEHALPQLTIAPDDTIARLIAQRIFKSPDLDREQEVASAYTDCIASDDQRTTITELTAIPLQVGTNVLNQFSPEGRPAIITLQWQDEGKGKGHDVFFVVTQQEDTTYHGIRFWPTSEGVDGQMRITDIPNHDHDMIRSVRFAFGKVDGLNSSLMLLANRDDTDTTYEVYRLQHVDEWDVFTRIEQKQLPERYCNADLALSVASGLPLRESYKGVRDSAGNPVTRGCR